MSHLEEGLGSVSPPGAPKTWPRESHLNLSPSLSLALHQEGVCVRGPVRLETPASQARLMHGEEGATWTRTLNPPIPGPWHPGHPGASLPPSATSAAAPPPVRPPSGPPGSPAHAGRCCAAGHPGPGRPRLGPALRGCRCRRGRGMRGMHARASPLAWLPGGFRMGRGRGRGAPLPRRPRPRNAHWPAAGRTCKTGPTHQIEPRPICARPRPPI